MILNGLTSLDIFLIVVASILGVELILCLVGLLFVLAFKSILKKHTKALKVVLYTKYDVTNKLIKLFIDAKINLDENLLNAFNKIKLEDFDKIDSTECLESRKSLSFLRDELLYIGSSNELIRKDNRFIEGKNSILELDKVYRNSIAMYNADVLGYNYWIMFLPYRFIYKLFKIKKKEII